MIVRIKRIDKKLPLPEYHTKGAVAFDLIARVTTVIKPGEIERIPANVVVEIPQGYMLLLKDRSSTGKKKHLLSLVGFIDQDYCGDKDELTMQFYNFDKDPVTVERGERLGQAAFVRTDIAEFIEVKTMNKKNRGAFGTTG